MAIGLSHGGTTIYSSPSRSNEVLVGTREGIAMIAREGSAWQVAHRALTDRHISAIIIEPESGLTIAGAFHGSVHVSADGGRTWEPRGNGLTQTNVYSLASARVDGHARLYAGPEPGHPRLSDALGLHWTAVPSPPSVPSVPNWSSRAPSPIGRVKHITYVPGTTTTIAGR